MVIALTLSLLALGDCPPDLAALWSELRDPDSVMAWRSMRTMMRTPGCVDFLKDRMKHDEPIPAETIARLMKQLNDEEFDERAVAEKKLIELGHGICPRLRNRLADKHDTLEARRRLERVLAKIEDTPLPIDLQQQYRAVEVLAGIDSDDARALLAALAKGPKYSLLTEAARRRMP